VFYISSEKIFLVFLLDTRVLDVHNGDMVDTLCEQYELRQRANYYKSLHARVCKREALLKKNVSDLQTVVRSQKRQLAEYSKIIETLTARVKWLARQFFGNKSEVSPKQDSEVGGEKTEQEQNAEHQEEENETDDAETSELTSSPEKKKRKRGQQRGKKSSGRTCHTELPIEEVIVDMPELDRLCPNCGLPHDVNCGTQDSEVIDVEVKIVRRRYKRKRYGRSCNCKGVPHVMITPVPPKLIPKGKFSTGFWTWVLERKYLFQIPMYRTLKMLELQGLKVSQGTVTDNLKRIAELIQPLYASILERGRNANHWHMDETRWKVFEDIEGKKGHRWWLWIVVTRDTCLYLLDPTRSSDVPKNFLGENPEGIISADRYSAYKSLLSDLLKIAYCWVHVRRDFCRIRDGYPKLKQWASTWIERINDLFHCNAKRINTQQNSRAFGEYDRDLRKRMAAVEQVRDEELSDSELHEAKRKALKSMKNHWDGLEIFLDNPDIPMDNNTAERGIRPPVTGRKNYYGSGSVWSGMFSVMMFTLFQTLLMNNVNPHDFLLAYFDACARNKGHPPDNIDEFLPWRFGREDTKVS